MAKKKQKNMRRYKRHSRKAAAVTQQLGTSRAPATRPRTYGPSAYGMELEARRRREGRDPVSGELVRPTLFDELELSPAGAMRERAVSCRECGASTWGLST